MAWKLWVLLHDDSGKSIPALLCIVQLSVSSGRTDLFVQVVMQTFALSSVSTVSCNFPNDECQMAGG